MPDGFSITKVTKRVFDVIYPPTGIRSELNKVDNDGGFPVIDWLTRLTSFIGFPNRFYDQHAPQSFSNLLKNFIGYQDNVSVGKKIVNVIVIPITTVLNLINLPFKFLLNIVKIFTEFLPLWVAIAQKDLRKELSTRVSDNFSLRDVGLLTLMGLTVLVERISRLILFVGRAITSPINNILDAADDYQRTQTIAGTILNLFKMGLSVTFTFLAYTLLFPLMVKPLMGMVTQFLATHLPSGVVSAIKMAGEFFSAAGKHFFTPAASFIAEILSFNSANLFAFTAGLNQALVGFFGLVGVVVPFLGPIINFAIKELDNWWHAPINPPRALLANPPAVNPPPINNTHNDVRARLGVSPQFDDIVPAPYQAPPPLAQPVGRVVNVSRPTPVPSKPTESRPQNFSPRK